MCDIIFYTTKNHPGTADVPLITAFRRRVVGGNSHEMRKQYRNESISGIPIGIVGFEPTY